MIKAMFGPFFKRFFGLFISMVFVSMLAVGLLCCFGSCIINVRNNYQEFVKDYQNIDEMISTDFTTREKLMSISELEEVEELDSRLVVDCYLLKETDNKGKPLKETRTIVARVFSFNEFEDTLFSRYAIKTATPSTEYINISVAEKFAKNNGFKVGQVVKLGFFNMYADFYISEIVDTPEGMYPRANNYIWSDNHDFGYIYASEQELNNGLHKIANNIVDKIASDPKYKEYYDQAAAVTGITIPVLEEIINSTNYVSKFANQILVKNAPNTKIDDVSAKINAKYEELGVKVKTTVVKNYLPHIAYMDHALDQMQVASIFLPAFFYGVTMIVVGLFINQIIKSMTSQIGVFMSIGIDNNEIVRLFLLFTTVMALTAGLLGAPIGYGLTFIMASMMKKTYCIPTIAPGLHVLVTVGAILGLLIFTFVTTLIATRAIFRITPKDATISNEAKRKRLPKPVEKFIDKAPMNIKLGVNSIAQNPRRFFVSSFSIFASLVLILMASLFHVSKDELIDQSVNRRLNYDCQIYLTQKEDDQDFVNGLKAQSKGEDGFEECYYTYLKVDVDSKDDVYIECLAVDPGKNPLINIPKKSGFGTQDVPETGLILPSTTAEKLKVKKGDNIKINGVSVKVQAISFQYFHPITYLSKAQMELISTEYVSSYIMNVANTGSLLKYLSDNRNQSLTVFTESLSQDLHSVFDSTNIMIYIMIAFSLGMAFIILVIMSQNALMEQQRQLTILRAVGFTVLDISNVWTLQSASQLLVSALFGIPVGALSIYALLRLCSSVTQTYPFILSWVVVLIAMAFILLVVTGCHLIAMRSIKKWNIADNTRSRE